MSAYTLLPGLSVVEISSRVLQMGTDPDTAWVLEHMGGRFAEFLRELPSSFSFENYQRLAKRHLIPTDAATDLWHMLRSRRLLIENADLRPTFSSGRPLDIEAAALALRRTEPPVALLESRGGQRVFINGTGGLAHGLKEILLGSGLGRVWCADDTRRARNASLTVVMDHTAPSALIARAHARRGIPYLMVDVMDGTLCVGPLVVPGSTPCVHCVELHQRDARPYLSRSWYGHRRDGMLLEKVMESIGAAMATVMILQYIDGGLSKGDGSTLRVVPSLSMTKQEWTVHPECACIPKPRVVP